MTLPHSKCKREFFQWSVFKEQETFNSLGASRSPLELSRQDLDNRKVHLGPQTLNFLVTRSPAVVILRGGELEKKTESYKEQPTSLSEHGFSNVLL